MATKNDITGDALISRNASKAYLNNYDLIFRKEKPQKEKENGRTIEPKTHRNGEAKDTGKRPD